MRLLNFFRTAFTQQSPLYVKFTFFYEVAAVESWGGLIGGLAELPKLYDVCPDGIQPGIYVNRQGAAPTANASNLELKDRIGSVEPTSDERNILAVIRERVLHDLEHSDFEKEVDSLGHLSGTKDKRDNIISDLYLRFDNVPRPVLLQALKMNAMLSRNPRPDGINLFLNFIVGESVGVADAVSVDNNPLVKQFRRVLETVSAEMLAGRMQVTNELLQRLETLFSAPHTIAAPTPAAAASRAP